MRHIGCGLAGVIRKEPEMAMGDLKASSSLARVVRRSTFFQGQFPKEMSESLTPAGLEQAGFTRLAEEYYRKDFSGVVELTIGAIPGRGHLYRWHIDINRLEKVNNELLTIRNRIDREARRVYAEWERATAKDRQAKVKKPPGGFDPGGFLRELCSARETICQKRIAFKNRHNDFMNLFTSSGPESGTYRCNCFPIEACSTTRDLRVYFDFVKLYLEIFVGVEKSKTGRAIPRESRESAIQMYYAVLAVVKRMRKRYDEIGDYGAIKTECPEVLRSSADKILLPGEASSRKWEFKASEIALELVSPMYGTKRQNLRDLLRKSRPYSAIAKEYVASLEDPAKLLSGSGPLPELLPIALTHYGKGSMQRMIRSFLIRQ
jgi:hypothetical protein